MISPKVAATEGLSRSWKTTIGGPSSSPKRATWASRPAYASPLRGGAEARKVAVAAKPTIGGRSG
ncbi:MAG: hypothetical protein MUE48_03165 [Desulfobacterales bacterium]|nr:hypothetical protein [Desulfobacterales bacterium]